MLKGASVQMTRKDIDYAQNVIIPIFKFLGKSQA